jgi:16S rRNA processing protein RimM
MAVVGRVAKAHGLQGQVVVALETDFPFERFRPGAELFVQRGNVVERLAVTAVRFQRQRPILGLSGVDTVDAAEALAGAELRVPIERLSELPEGSFYRHDLVGCRVETGRGEPVGVVSAVEGDSGGSRLVVATERGAVLVPLAAAICRTIEVARKRIVIDPPEGLLDLNTQP